LSGVLVSDPDKIPPPNDRVIFSPLLRVCWGFVFRAKNDGFFGLWNLFFELIAWLLVQKIVFTE